MCSLISDYEFYEQIGSGAYAVVVRCKHLTSGNIIAAKIYDKFKMNDSDKKKSLQQEVKIMKRLWHPKIVKLYEVIDTSWYVYLMLEYCRGKSLQDLIRSWGDKKFDENESRFLIKQLLLAIEYLHSRKIVHWDIKLENMILNEDLNLKIIDFGFSSK